MKYKIAKEYTDMPGGRYKKDGEFSGEEFRDEVLIPKIKECIKNNTVLEINLDETFGYPPSFLEEAFGGLVRKMVVDKKELLKSLKFISEEEPYLIGKIKEYINDGDK